jgi:hypothetical protein
MSGCRGFAMSLEAAFSLTLLLIAGTALPAFSPPENAAPDFFLCSDAALALAKSGSFSGTGQQLQAMLDEMHSLSGMCFSEGSIASAGCALQKNPQKEKTAFTVPYCSAGAVGKKTVSCWREN